MPERLAFLGRNAPFPQARVVILGVPWERTVSWRGGPGQGPAAIRLASDSIEFFSAHFRKDLRNLEICDLGDIDPYRATEEVLAEEEKEVGRILRAGKNPVVLGGEHTVAIPAVRAAAQLGPLQVLALDAHSDLRQEYLGLRVCHATALRRISEIADELVIVGARSFFGEEIEEPFFSNPQDFPARLRPELPLWITLDLDALDPSLCPGVTNPEPGGLSYPEVIEIFRKLRGFRILGLDLVELAPPYDPSVVSAITAAKLVLEAIAAFWA